MKLLAMIYKGQPTAVLGYCPDRKGRPRAIIAWRGRPKAVRLEALKLMGEMAEPGFLAAHLASAASPSEARH